MATRPYSGTFEFFHFLISWSKIWVVGRLHMSRMFKKFVLVLKKDLKSFLRQHLIVSRKKFPEVTIGLIIIYFPSEAI